MTQKIQETSDYGKFELLPFNRDVKKIKYLEQSMRKYGYLDPYPLHVVRNFNGKLRIKAGHHRFSVARKLAIPVKYIVCDDGGITVYELEKSTTTWSLQDYLISNIKEGRHAYIAVKQYYDRTDIPLLCCISLLGGETAGSSNKVDSFKAGIFELGDPQNANLVETIINFLKDRCGVKWASNSRLVSAISRMCWVEEFDSKRFMKKVKEHSYLLEKQPSIEAYGDMIELIYNRHSQNKAPLKFLADDMARKRNPAKKDK